MHSTSPHELIARAIITQDDCLLVNQGTHHQTSHSYYALPGGHVEDGETCVAALQRELQEELAIECSVGDLCFVIEHQYSGRHENDSPRHEVTLYFQATTNTALPQKDEEISSPEVIKNFRWIPLNSLQEAPLLPEVSRELLQKYFSEHPISHYAFQDNTSEHNN